MFSSVFSTVFFWRKRSSTQVVDAAPATTEVHVLTIEFKTEDDNAQPSTPDSLPYAAATTPPPAAYYSPIQLQDAAMSDFFGGTRTFRSRDSQGFLPPYSPTAASEALPAYPGHPQDEPATLARFLFIYGFFFPPFWLIGIAILLSPLKTTPDWEMGKTEEEKATLLNRLRTEELKWAKKCLWATLTLLALIAVAATIIYLTVFRK